MDVASVLGNAASGGLLGVLGSLGSAGIEYVNARASAKETLAKTQIDYAHELEVKDRDNDRARQASQEDFAKSDMQARFEGLQKAIEDQVAMSARVAGPVLDILALFRPGLTVLLIVMVFVFGLLKLQSYFGYAVELAAMAVAWWFGDRQRSKFSGVN
jgi:hypothetical protein